MTYQVPWFLCEAVSSQPRAFAFGMQAVDHAKERLSAMFDGEEAYSELDFPVLHTFVNFVEAERPEPTAGLRLVLTVEDSHVAVAVKDRQVELQAKPPRTGRRPAPPAPFTLDGLPPRIAAAKRLGTTAMKTVRQQFEDRLPSSALLKALAIIDPRFWAVVKPTSQQFISTMAPLREQFCQDKELPDGAPVVWQNHQQELRSAIAAKEEAQAAGKRCKVEMPPSPTTTLWQEVSQEPASASSIPEFIRLAQLVMVIATGSVEDERTFSDMNFIKNDLRSRLDEPHLNVCMRLFACYWMHTLANFPYLMAYTCFSHEKRSQMKPHHESMQWVLVLVASEYSLVCLCLSLLCELGFRVCRQLLRWAHINLLPKPRVQHNILCFWAKLA